jgi:sulfiredoxin
MSLFNARNHFFSLILAFFKQNSASNSSLLKMASDLTIHSAHIDDIYEMPIDQIIRPLPSILDECKVDSLVKTLQVSLPTHSLNPILSSKFFLI